MLIDPKGELGFNYLYIVKSRKNCRESEAPAELATLRFGRSLTLPENAVLECGK